MAKYTIELRKVCDYYTREVVEGWFKDYNISDFLTPEQIETINNAGVWNKDKLASQIVDHYFMREIGFETPALFSHYAKVTMKEIMEEKLQIIYSQSIKIDPLVNVDFTETFERGIDSTGNNTTNSNGTSNSNSQNTGSGLNVASDTPQGQINKQEILNGKYASTTNATETENNITDTTTTSSDATSNNTSNTKETYTRHQKGNSGVMATAQKLIEQYRQIIVATNKDIINELDTLFMGIF